MNYRSSPPIQFLPVFDAAARHLSFKKAAEELSVSAAAVGQQVKAFEHWLGKALLLRHTRRLTLTPEGEYYARLARDIVSQHTQGYQNFRQRFERRMLRLSAPFFVSQEVLLPHYLSFSDYLPGRELRLESSDELGSLLQQDISAAVRFGHGQWPGLDALLLCKTQAAPVCSPEYARQHDVSQLSQLTRHRLIFAKPGMEQWHRNFIADDQPDPAEAIVCDAYPAALKAATEGMGIAMGLFPITNQWLNQQRLQPCFCEPRDTGRGFYLVWPSQQPVPDYIAALSRWLQHIFEQLPAFSFSSPEDKNNHR